MGTLWNQYIRWVMKKLSSTGLEQELNQKEIIGELVFPEIAAVARQMAAEGIVLLKNERNTLPLSVNDTVAVFGRCAVDYFTVGYGSGGDVVAPYRNNLMEGLRENGAACMSLWPNAIANGALAIKMSRPRASGETGP